MITLTRIREIPDQGVMGVLFVPALERKFYTIEQNWRDNTRGISCVPEGKYQLFRRNSPRYGPSFHLYNPILGVWLTQGDIPPAMNAKGEGRSHVLIHAANLAEQLQGCIALGLNKGRLYSNRLGRHAQAVLSSRVACESFNAWLSSTRDQTTSLLIKRGTYETFGE